MIFFFDNFYQKLETCNKFCTTASERNIRQNLSEIENQEKAKIVSFKSSFYFSPQGFLFDILMRAYNLVYRA